MKTSSKLAAVVFLTGVIGLACRREEKGGEKIVAEDDSPKEKPKHDAKPAPAATPAKTGKVGLDDPTSDPSLIAAVKKMLTTCGKRMDEIFTGTKKHSLWTCGDDWKSFTTTKIPDEKTTTSTLVNLLEDPDVKVRAVAVYRLDEWGGGLWRTDHALAARMIAALKNEGPHSPIDGSWARLVSRIRPEAGVDDDLEKLMIDPATQLDIKLNYVAWSETEVAHRVTKAFADSGDPTLVNGAVQGYLHSFGAHKAEACSYWSSHLETPDTTVNQYAFGHLTGGWTGNTTSDSESEDSCTGGGGGPEEGSVCSEADLQMALDVATKTFDTGGKPNAFLYYGLGRGLVKLKSTPPAIKKGAIALLQKMVETKGYPDRADALKALVENAPSYEAYAHKFAGDSELKEAVAELEAKKD